jgi:hypothetical protein
MQPPSDKPDASMSAEPLIDETLRDRLIATPDVLLDDQEIMRALVSANERAMGSNIVDLRGIAMQRLEQRLDRLEDTHRSVIAAAYENLAGTNMIHRAVLRMMEPVRFETFLRDLTGDVAAILRVDALRLVLESAETRLDPAVARLSDTLVMVPQDYIHDYIQRGRDLAVRPVTLRQIAPSDGGLYGDRAQFIRSEACLRLDLGPGRLPGMLVLGSEDPHQFSPQQGTDLLAFFGGVVERVMRRWLA